MGRMSKGRQKIAMVKMENESNLQVTFSKRRAGLFKKASELATLCGAEMVLIVFSPAEKPFSFGSPNVDAVVDRFLNDNIPQQLGPVPHVLEAQRGVKMRELNLQLTQVLQEVEAEKKRFQEVKKLLNENQSQNWWEKPIEELTLPQLEQLKFALEELKKEVTRQGERIMIAAARLIPQQQQQNFYGASSSADPVVPYDDPMVPYDDNNTIITNIDDNNNPPSLPPPPPPMMPPPGYNFGGGSSGFY